MLINTDISFAIKNACGQYEINESSIFHMEKLKSKFPLVNIDTEKNKVLKIQVKCPICSERHVYNYNINDLFKREMIIGGCENSGTPVFYLGNHNKLLERIQKLNNISSKLYAML